MNDNDIIKAFKKCISNNVHKCEGCPFSISETDCDSLENEILDLINRQKAQIDILCNSLHVSSQNLENMARAMPNIAKATRDAAFKEFAKRLKAEIVAKCCVVDDDVDYILKFIDNLVKEKTEGEDGN